MAGIRWRYIVLVLLGAWMAFLPVLGFPRSFKNWLFVISGLLVIFFTYYAYIGSFTRVQAMRKNTHGETSGE